MIIPLILLACLLLVVIIFSPMRLSVYSSSSLLSPLQLLVTMDMDWCVGAGGIAILVDSQERWFVASQISKPDSMESKTFCRVVSSSVSQEAKQSVLLASLAYDRSTTVAIKSCNIGTTPITLTSLILSAGLCHDHCSTTRSRL